MKVSNRSIFFANASNSILLFFMLLVVGSVARLGMDVPNFKPLGAVCLIAGLMFRDVRVAILLPVTAMLFSDFFLGFYEPLLAIAVYGSLLLNVVMGRTAKNWIFGPQQSIASRIVATLGLAVTSSLQFFILTNLAVGLFSGWYPLSFSGMSGCFVAALPFFRFTLAGDIVFFAAPVIVSILVQSTFTRQRLAFETNYTVVAPQKKPANQHSR